MAEPLGASNVGLFSILITHEKKAFMCQAELGI